MINLAQPLIGIPGGGLPNVALVTFTDENRREVLKCHAKVKGADALEPDKPVPASAVACDILVPGTRYGWLIVPIAKESPTNG